MKKNIIFTILALVWIIILWAISYPTISYWLSEQAKLYKKHSIYVSELQTTREKLTEARKEVNRLEIIEKKQEKEKTEIEFEIFSLWELENNVILSEMSVDILSWSVEWITALWWVEEIDLLEADYEKALIEDAKLKNPDMSEEELMKIYNSIN